MATIKPAKYILNTDLATLANDSATISISVSIPATVITSGTPQTYTGTAIVGTIGSPIEYDINYSSSARRWKSPSLLFIENEGAASQYQGTAYVFKSAANTVKVYVTVYYGGAGSITKTARTVTVKVKTFIPPFA